MTTKLYMDGDDLIEHKQVDVSVNLEYAKSLRSTG